MSTKNTASKFFTVNLADVKIPDVKPTRIKFNESEDFVKWGIGNKWPNYLIESVQKSTVHSGYIRRRRSMISGEGFSVSDNAKEALKKINGEGMSADKLLKRVAVDLSILEMMAVQVIWSKDRKSIAELHYVDSSKMRPHKVTDEYDNVLGYWLCADWQDYKRQEPVFIEAFSADPANIGRGYKAAQLTDKQKKADVGAQLFVHFKQTLGQSFFPEVSYTSCLNAVELEGELSKYGLNTVLNGFFAGAILEHVANMTDEEKFQFQQDVKSNFVGSENANKLMIIISEQLDTVKITPYNSADSTSLLNALKDNAIGQICTAHGGDSILANVTKDGSTLGSDGKLYNTALQIYHNTVIRELQEGPLEIITHYLESKGFTDFDLDITSRSMTTEELDNQTKLDEQDFC